VIRSDKEGLRHHTVSYHQVTLSLFLYFLASFFFFIIHSYFPYILFSSIKFYFFMFMFVFVLFGYHIFSEVTRNICKPVMWLRNTLVYKNSTWLIMFCKTCSCIYNPLTNKDDSTHLWTWFVSTILPIHVMTRTIFYSCFVKLHLFSIYFVTKLTQHILRFGL